MASGTETASSGGVLRGFGSEKGPEFYDNHSAGRAHRQVHYTRSRYYPLWTLVADRWRRGGALPVLELGCGTGQLARLLLDRGCGDYLGIDFSTAMIEQARKAAPQARFAIADIRRADQLETEPYGCAIMLEVLEHLEADLAVIERLRAGTRVLASVPNFPAEAHVRHFRDCAAVRARYAPLLAGCEVSEVQMDAYGARLFLIEGMR